MTVDGRVDFSVSGLWQFELKCTFSRLTTVHEGWKEMYIVLNLEYHLISLYSHVSYELLIFIDFFYIQHFLNICIFKLSPLKISINGTCLPLQLHLRGSKLLLLKCYHIFISFLVCI